MVQRAVQACAQELARACGGAARADDWWAARGLDVADWHALAANTLVEVCVCYAARRKELAFIAQ